MRKQIFQGNVYFHSQNDTTYTDVNGTMVHANTSLEILKELNEDLYRFAKEKLSASYDCMEEIYGSLAGLKVDDILKATDRICKRDILKPDFYERLKDMYPSPLVMITRMMQEVAERVAENVVVPIYYRNVPEEYRIGHIGVIGSICEVKDGKLTGNVKAVPDYWERSYIVLADIFASEGDFKRAGKIAKMTTYPDLGAGIDYKF